MKKIVSGVITAALALLLAFTDVVGGVTSISAAVAADMPAITLNGTVTQGDPGYLNPKAVVLSSGTETRVSYRLVPDYASGEAVGVQVKIFLPSLEYVDGEYRVLGRDRAPSELGIQGRVVAGGGWHVVSDTTVRGGPVIMEYDGSLGAGANPAFDLYLTTYNDGTDGPYGGVPEGTSFELNGFVSYEMFNRVEESSWSTPYELDDESRVSVISSDLTWETDIQSYVPGGGPDLVPIWDRYQYIDYVYSITNTSENVASNIDGYSATFDIDSTASNVNGIIPFDINRWVYNEDGPPAVNDDLNYISGQFVGVPGQGGILIYDVTDWDGESELTDEIPYTYSGTGLVTIDRQHGAAKQELTPDGVAGATERKFLISLPLSRQGFPNPPTNFKVAAITNVLFAKTANWAKTRVVEREIVLPAYDFAFTHTTRQNDVVYGYETYNEITDLRSDSNAPVFDPVLAYQVDEDFALDRVTYEFDQTAAESFENAEITYSYIDEETAEAVTRTISPILREQDEDTGLVTLTFDVSELRELDWDRTLSLSLVDRVEPGSTLPLSIKVFGEPYRVGEMASQATVTYIEKIASNDDFGQNTTYTEVEHQTAVDTSFNVIYPEEVIPSIQVSIDGKGARATVPYETASLIDFLFGVNDTVAENSTTTLVLNTDAERLKNAELILRAALFEHAQNLRVSYETMDGDIEEIDLSAYAGTGDFNVALPERAAKVIIDSDEFASSGSANFVSVSAQIGHGLDKLHTVTGEIRTYQPKPYDRDTTRTATGTIDIQLPNELVPAVDVIGVYGSRKTQTTTHVGYESTFGVEYQLDTRGVNSPSSEYVIDTLAPTKSGSLEFRSISLQEALLDSITDPKVTFVDRSGDEQEFTSSEVTSDEVTLENVAKIIVSGENLHLDGLQTIAIVEYSADIEIGSSQTVRATFTGTQEPPYENSKTATKNNQIIVRETKTEVQVEGVNQVNKGLGVGNDYSVDIYRCWSCGTWYGTADYTLDQGYKSLGGFTSTVTRPTAAYDNNDQRVTVEADLPYEHFDLYYLKIREALQPYIDTVDVYRVVDGEEVLWKSVPGSEWVNNTQEGSGFWRINTARPDMTDDELFATYDSVANVSAHPYYKGAWEPDVRPEAPVSRVEVNLRFTRESNDAVPQLAGTQHDVVEYMGRFHSSSPGRKLPTVLTTSDSFGAKRVLTRTHTHSVNSLVGFPYAQTRTGANDNTSLSNKVVVMGGVGEYLASIWNVNNAGWSNYSGHGPDVYSPASTEYDEWLGLYDPASFHDQLVYEFVYPDSPDDDGVYNLEARHVVIADTSTLQYLTGVRATGESGESVSMRFDQPLAAAARFDYDNTQPPGVYDDGDGTFTISFGPDGGYPQKFEAFFEQIEGFGERTAEIDGVAANTLGASLAEVDVRVGGVVNGNRALRGTTNLYRVPSDTEQKTLLHTSSATLTGYTPKLGAELEMSFDQLKVYDYEADGITPNTTRLAVGIRNRSEADIKDAVINVRPDSAFRSRLIEIPSDIFAGGDWSVKSVVVTQGTQNVTLDLAQFTDAGNGFHVLDLQALFDDGTLATQDDGVTLGGAATLHRQHLDNIAVSFQPKDDSIRLWGSLAQADTAEPLPTRMREGGDVFLTGVWVDDDGTGPSWNSKPSFVTEQSKGSNEVVMRYSSFTTSAVVTSYQTIFVSEGSGNRGERPTLTLASASGHAAPRLYTRVARMNINAVHMQNDFSEADATNLFYDADTDAQISYTNIAVGDTAKVLYELRNVGARAPDAASPGSLPIFQPVAHIEAPAGLSISGVEATTDFLRADANREGLVEGSPNSDVAVSEGAVTITKLNNKRADVAFDVTLLDGESVFFYVEYTATNDFGAALGATQGRNLQWNVYARPAYTHHFMSYDSAGLNGNRVAGTTAAVNYDDHSMVEQLGRVSNHNYRYADPNQLVIESRFNSENVSGQEMTLTVRNIRNEILHDNTQLDLYLTLDKGALSAFELSEFPTPQYPDGFTGTFGQGESGIAAPKVFFAHGTEWVAVERFDPDVHSLAEINELKVSYGIVPATDPSTGSTFEPKPFDIHGIGHWRTADAQTTKSYVLTSQARTVLTHQDDEESPVGEYAYLTEAGQRVYKAIPTVEFNVQSFGSLAEAQSLYDGAAVGKTDYLPGDSLFYRLTAKNHTTYQGTNTNTPYGKAPLRHPVIFDKIPEYLSTGLMEHVSEGVLDVEAAIAAGVLEIEVRDASGDPRPAGYALPTVTVQRVQGLDIAGSQRFNNGRHNDGWGLISTAEPVNTTVNPADEIQFDVFTYDFDSEQLGRGEQIEIIYGAQVRSDNLPVARYTNGKSVFAPFFGWYGSNVPVANSAMNHSMDMASLLHDAGISGDRGHEMTQAEFLSNSFSWQPGANGQRRQPTNSSGSYTQATFYDDSANKRKSHTAYLRETASNDLYTTFASSALDENYNLASKGRVNDGAVPFDERIMWAQDGMQLNRAWLYGASEMLPDTQRAAYGVDPANFYEHDGTLNSYNRHRLGYTPYVDDPYTYAVQLHEQFTVRLHAANLGDRPIGSGLEYTEILPLGITPFDEAGDLLGITAFDGRGTAIPSADVVYEVIQTPESDQGYRAPAQSQEAGSYAEASREDGIPYVVRVRVASPVSGMFNSPGASAADKYQRVDIRVQVYDELPPLEGSNISYWHDEFTLTSVAEEPYLETYTQEYGAFNRAIGTSNTARYPNDGMAQGIEVNDLLYDFGTYTSYFSIEPWGRYVRGLNAQATATTSGGKPALVTGDQIAMRKPTLRVWSSPSKDGYEGVYDTTVEDFSVDLYEEFTIRSTVENQQLEVLGEYNRVNSGYNRYSGDNFNDDIWRNAPQTIGGARGSWFEPTVTIALPYGVAPVLEDGSYGRYYRDIDEQQNVSFTASVNDVTYNSSIPVNDVTEQFDVKVELLEGTAGKRFVLHFTVKRDRAADVAYGQSLVVSPRVVTIDTPAFGPDTDDSRYGEVLTLANTQRPVFNPVVSGQYTTGSTPSLSARDQGVSSAPNNVKSSNGLSVTANDRTRRDSTSTWSTNMGVLKITERLISATQSYDDDTEIALNDNIGWKASGEALTPEGLDSKHQKSGAYGGTSINLRKPSITNTTKLAHYADSTETDLLRVDAAGKFWYSTEVANAPESHANPYEEIKTAGDVHNSRFVVTHHVTNFAAATGEVRLRIGDDLYDRAAFQALGYTVERLTPGELEVDEHRDRIQWLVTTPVNERGTLGQLKSGENFTLLYEVQMVGGYEDNVASEDDVWSADELIADSYVSLVTDDTTLVQAGAAQDPEDFIVQSPTSMRYHTYASDPGAGIDIDGNGDLEGRYAADDVEIEILKPKAEVRVNTTRPRIAYSNGLSGDTYFNSSDIIEYLVTHARNVGSGLKEFVVENIVPTHETNDSTVSLSNLPISTSTLYTSSGAWELPQETLDRLSADGITVDEAFRTYVYVSHELAEDGYEGGSWTLLNPGGTSILSNERFDIPGSERSGLKKIRVVVKALQPDRYLVPQGLGLDIDADPDTDGKQSVLETDPTNQSITQYPQTVSDAAIQLGMRIASNAKSTLFVYGTAQVWGNYVGTSVSKLAQSQTRSYLTPSRPVVNVKYDALYYRSDSSRPVDERFGWSDIMAIAPKSSPHLKFKSEFINADETMWSRDEDNTYSEDTLVDPFVTFQLPSVMESGGAFTYVPADEITAGHPLSDEHRSRYSLTGNENNLWTWKLVRADGSEASPDSHLRHTDIYSGPWDGFDRNVVSIWFTGSVYPGDKIVVEFIGSVDAYSPGADAEDLKSRAVITNSTGLLYPLNSQQNSANRLGYSTDYNDFNKNQLLVDRLVFSEKTLFQYETYDNFGKRKVAFSDLNRAGTVAPEMTPVRQGGDFSFEVSVDNSKEVGDRPYPYPIIYDVLPFADDTSISNSTIPRGSRYSAWLKPDGMKLERDGAEKKTYLPSEYTVYVGPLTKQGGEIVEAPMVPHAEAASESFFDSLGLPGQPSAVRDGHFVTLDEIKDDPELLKKARTVLVLFNNGAEVLPGQSKLKFTYDMKAPLNAPTFLEQFDEPEKKRDAALWNSFVATQRVSRFIPQESNTAGAYAMEKRDHVYIGNYVWNDVNYNGLQDEGDPFADANGRTLLDPTKDLNFDGQIDDPGINGVRATLLTPSGYNVDALGNPIHRVSDHWEIVDEDTGESVLDEVFQQPIRSEGPLVTVTETDYHGNDGYYTFSNIQPGEYRVMLEFPRAYDRFSATTEEVFKNSRVRVYAPGEQLDIPAEVDDEALVTITDAARVDVDTTDEERMSFDFGVAQKVRVGGTIFKEDIATLDGYQAGATETGIEGYHVYLKRMNGETAVDADGDPLVAVTDEQGKYAFDLLPIDRQYYVQVTDQHDGFSTEWVVSPFVHHVDPFAEANDNDGSTEKGSKTVRTNTLHFDLEGLFGTGFADRESVSIGFYEKSTYGVIGNRVWNDLNRDGIQDEGEPGVEGQTLRLEQYVRDGGEWTRTAFSDTAVSNADGYYYFMRVPSTVFEDGRPVDTAYQVVVDELVTGYTFALPHRQSNAGSDPAESDSDFFKNGTMHETAVVGEYLVSIADLDDATGVISGLDDNTVDLGLVPHARSTLSGEVFIDSDGDGVKNDAAEADEIYTAALEVLFGGNWVEVRQDADGRMIEPAYAQASDAPMTQTGVASYAFENLHIIDSEQRVPYEYRVRVSQVPLWQQVTGLHVGDDESEDNDFVHETRGLYNSAVSDVRVLGELQEQLLPIETFEGIPARDVDLGVVNLKTQAKIGDRIWNDVDGDGMQDPGEPGMDGIRVVLNRLVDGELIYVAETRTGADGAYEFTADVADHDPVSVGFNTPHVYVVEFNLSSRQTLSPIGSGSGATDSRFVNLITAGGALYDHGIADSRHTAVSEEFSLVDVDGSGYALYDTAGAVDHIDGGVITHDTVRVIGDTVYDDRDRNGVQSADEPGIGGLNVRIFKLNRDTGLWEAYEGPDGSSTITDARGEYRFSVEVADLDKDSAHYRSAEEYRVLIEAPANMRLVEVDNVFFYQAAPDVDGIAIAKPHSFVLSDAMTLIDSGVDGVDLNSARDVLTADAGFAVFDASVTIGGRIWDDVDLNGLQDAGEPGIAGRTVLLWELVDGEWAQVDDLEGRGRAVTAADGGYAFEVSPTHYDENAPGFLAPREYRVTTEREGYHVWSPLNVGDDPAIDSDVRPAAPEFGTPYTGVTRVFSVADHDGAMVDITSVRDDLRMDIGLKVYDHLGVIGGDIWEDSNEDGDRQAGEPFLEGRQVTLWERAEGEWTIVEDAHGYSTRITDERGHYEFEVEPTTYDVESERYLQPREYRTTVEVPQGYRLSDGSRTAALHEQLATSLTAQISELDVEGNVELSETRDDLTLSFPFALVPADADLALTGARLNVVYAALVVALGAVVVFVGARRQRKNARQEP